MESKTREQAEQKIKNRMMPSSNDDRSRLWAQQKEKLVAKDNQTEWFFRFKDESSIVEIKKKRVWSQPYKTVQV